MQFEHYFRLSATSGAGVRCDERGLFAGDTPLLERPASDKLAKWRPRPLVDLNRELGETYGEPIEFRGKLDGLTSVANALSRGDLVRAQIVALLLKIPEPPTITKANLSPSEVFDLRSRLQASGVLKTFDVRPYTTVQSIQDVMSGTDGRRGLDKYNPYHDERGRFTTAEGVARSESVRSNHPKGARVAMNDVGASSMDGAAAQVDARASPTSRPFETNQMRLANISCAELLESDIAICHSAIFADDHHHRKLCVEGAVQRNDECLSGFPISPLLPY